MNTAMRVLRSRAWFRPADCSVALCVVLDSRAVQASPYSVEQYVRMRLEPEIRKTVEQLETAVCREYQMD